METAVRHTRPAERRGRPGRSAERPRTFERRSGDHRAAPAGGRVRSASPVSSTLPYAVYMVLAVLAIALWVGHVQATDALMAETQGARQENLGLHLSVNRLKGDFDRLTGPSVVMDRAKRLGLVEGYRYGQTIIVTSSD